MSSFEITLTYILTSMFIREGFIDLVSLGVGHVLGYCLIKWHCYWGGSGRVLGKKRLSHGRAS